MSGDEKAARAIIRERSNGVCEVCGQGRAVDASHRLGRGQGGPWSASNLLHTCRQCHQAMHQSPTRAYAFGQHLRSGAIPADEPVRTRHGWVRLDDLGGMIAAPVDVAMPDDISATLSALNFEETR